MASNDPALQSSSRWADIPVDNKSTDDGDGFLQRDAEDASASAPLASKTQASPWCCWDFCGPGLLACLADTDAGCLVVAAQSGAGWGYSLLLMQILLIPILYFAQELTVRLAVHTGKGHAQCIKEQFGIVCAWCTTTLLSAECVITIISEMSGISAVVQLWGLGAGVGTIVSVVVIVGTIVIFNYRQIEMIGITLGLFELTFVFTMFWYHPSPVDVFTGMFTFHFDKREYLTLVAANLGAVLMPFMIYFQQSAVVARRLHPGADLDKERKVTLFGSCLTQLVMIATLITYAASRCKNLDNIQDMNSALEPALGPVVSKVMISLALVGGSLCAAFVASLAATWAICDTAGFDDTFSVDRSPREAPQFYAIFLFVVGIGVIVLQTGINVVTLNVFIELVNGLLMPAAVGFLFALASSEMLPPEARLSGSYKLLLAVLFSTCAVVALYSGISGILSHAGFSGKYTHHHLVALAPGRK